MSKHWAGETPHDAEIALLTHSTVVGASELNAKFRERRVGFLDAMNSTIVRELYETARACLDEGKDTDVCCGCHFHKLREALAAYKAGLKEEEA